MLWIYFAGRVLKRFWMTCANFENPHARHSGNIIFFRTRQYVQSTAFINFCFWWFFEIRFSRGVHSHCLCLGPGGLWSGLLSSRYVHGSDGENVDTDFANWNKNVASSCKWIAGLWSLLCTPIVWTNLIYESIIQNSIRTPEFSVCHSAEYNQRHSSLSFKNAVQKKLFHWKFGWSVMENSKLITFKKPFNEKNWCKKCFFDSFHRATLNHIHYPIANSQYMNKYILHTKLNLCLSELWIMVAKLLNGPRTTTARSTRPKINSTDNWAGGFWTNPSGDVQKTWRWQDLPSRSTRRAKVNLHHVLSFPHLSFSYPQDN